MAKIKVLIVDDSALMRQLLREILEQQPDFEVVDTAGDPMIARDKILKYNPDVLTLDVEMPRMDGLTFLEKLMAGRPMPVVMVSSLTERGCETTLKALELGAVDFVTKPKIDVSTGLDDIALEIVEKVRAASRAQVRRRSRATNDDRRVTKAPLNSEALIKSTHKVIAIGTSTGGTEALSEVLTSLPPDSPGIVAVIHMPERFTKSYAERLDRACQIRVKEAEDGDRILPGHALIAPGNFHMEAIRSGASYAVRVFPGDAVNRHRPSVDVLFNSCARYLGGNCVGAILTGMGNDGAAGLLAMRQAGAHTLAESEETCVVYGMPREAIEMGAAEEVLPLGSIGQRLIQLTRAMEVARV
ncbi:MAG: chemotaxis response regulator protein-glutamate methylesterase [Planctomycetales bacterium]|nr:chemotaxis response regulator protein-glutamate methylesterase [Planctomycetales bacterium]MCA9170512.1 chemotaxis response regulator protein-glutamate methylesterase [Planctomycetales bacterium]